MRLSLVDLLRCPGGHEESTLVASTGVMRDRHVMEGDLGCPVCGARYKVHRGVARFGSRPADRPPDTLPTTDAVSRLAALLDLDSPEGVVLLARGYSHLARGVREATGVQLFVIDPPTDLEMGAGLSGLAGAPRLPLAAGSVRAAAIDHACGDEPWMAGVVRAVRSRGRIVAPADLPLPDGVRELARDEREWVAEREPATPVIPLRTANR